MSGFKIGDLVRVVKGLGVGHIGEVADCLETGYLLVQYEDDNSEAHLFAPDELELVTRAPSVDRWHYYKNLETGEHMSTLYDGVADYYPWVESTEGEYRAYRERNQLVTSAQPAPASEPTAAGDDRWLGFPSREEYEAYLDKPLTDEERAAVGLGDDPDVVLLSEMHDILADANELPITHERMKDRMAGLRKLASEQVKVAPDLSSVDTLIRRGKRIDAVKEYYTIMKCGDLAAARDWVDRRTVELKREDEGKPTYEQLQAERDALEAQLYTLQAALAAEQAGRERAEKRLVMAEGTIDRISQRLPNTDSYNDVKSNWELVRKLAQLYMAIDSTSAQQAAADALAARLQSAEAALRGIVDDCTLKGVYVGDFHRDAVKRVVQRAQSALDNTAYVEPEPPPSFDEVFKGFKAAADALAGDVGGEG